MLTSQIVDVPNVSAEWYRDVVEFAGQTPPEIQWFAEHFTEGSILLLGLLLAIAGWQHLRAPAQRLALALVAPIGVVLAYGTSELLKLVVDEERPCRTFADVTIIAAQCPPTGDWSFPSNHSTIAGATAAVTLLLSTRIGALAAPIAVLEAFSRTFVGVHYPHDVLAGLLLGVLIATPVALLLARPVGSVVARYRRPQVHQFTR